ncbi:MAG TPA: Wadjet anti-phage system protein JetD domain-containing protein [Pseudomonas sp.]|uniref:Wadjet anti-phage system protein JetD domain-containing protein n=1 Tax=Pseudomonas sp. TaxID=306 RepID=UPI002B478F4C|nr:Wadjet anti-phage system protein JetD domain-containing protein [Pseudomonas sp.]HKS12564.1 Wadjet anti-phage system protein JetD domain-containing protein [Pseudomonas sp.]
MKSPSEIAASLSRQWQLSSVRLERLLSPDSWPRTVGIGKPSARVFNENIQAVQLHVQQWRQVSVGEVEWETITYRAGLTPVSLPVRWRLRTPSEWITAAANPAVSDEYAVLERLVEQVDNRFHSLLVAQRGLWLTKSPDEVIATARLAMRLSPGCAQGRPLRLLAEHCVDTKFFERNAALLTKLLDERFEGEVSEQGLTTFLDAFDESSHWVMVVPLFPGLLPFKRLRLTTAELGETPLPGSRVLVVENEQCIHQLPEARDTIAVLGAGLDLQWLASPQLAGKTLAYWGDMDTWGLLMLGRARLYQPTIKTLLMDQHLFDQYESGSAVVEPSKAQASVPEGLSLCEAALYRYLRVKPRGRLEQEYLPRETVHKAVLEWAQA